MVNNYSNELLHYGTKGMKWGIRRYQKKDGTLTNAGKKRIQESGTLGFPAYDRKKKQWKGNVKNRLSVDTSHDEEMQTAYKREHKRIMNDKTALKKAGYIFTDKPDSDIREHNDDIVAKLMIESKTARSLERKSVERYIDKYADATIADLGLVNTPQAKAFVKDHLSNSSTYVYRLLHDD